MVLALEVGEEHLRVTQRTTTGTATGHCLRMTEPGYYYWDLQNALQGPFSSEQLLSWQSLLPDDLLIYSLDSQNEWDSGTSFRLLRNLLQAEVCGLCVKTHLMAFTVQVHIRLCLFGQA
jgi:GYF domain